MTNITIDFIWTIHLLKTTADSNNEVQILVMKFIEWDSLQTFIKLSIQLAAAGHRRHEIFKLSLN